MVITKRGERLCLVAQRDHAVLAGALAERWGNGDFARPEPRHSVLLAAARHDDGWREYDERPAHNEELGRPYHFLEVPLPESIAFYGTGVDAVYRDDLYAGVLVGMHWAGLYSARWGVQAGPALADPAAIEVVEAQERRWTAAARELWAHDGLRSAFEARLWHNYELLQALDLLSLCLCTVDSGVPTDRAAPPVPVPATLRPIEQPPGARLIPEVPGTIGGAHRDLVVTVAEPGLVEVDPYPFADASLDLELPAKLIADRRYASAEEVAEAVRDAPVTVLSCRVVAASAA
jgi:hypothetical protein